MSSKSHKAALNDLRELYLTDHRQRFPSLPEYARTAPRYSDRTANGLTQCVIDYIRLHGGQAERINSTGRYIDRSQTYTDVIGRTRTIGSGQWIPTSGVKGTADVSATIRGRSVKIEIKMKDKQSEDQKRYQEAVEAAGGVYLIVRSFAEFKTWYDGLQ
jgi:hypothetical protein